MRRLLAHLLAVGLLAAGLSQLNAGKAEACVSTPGDLRIISRAIDAKTTPKADKAQLRRLRATMLANRGIDLRQVTKYQAASLKALRMIGENTVVPHDASKQAQPTGSSQGAAIGC